MGALARIGYALDHQTGSHFILRNIEYPHRRLTVPNHREISKGTLRAIMKQAGIDRTEFLKIISKRI